MSKWGYAFLVAYIAIGLSSLRLRKAGHVAVLLTVFGIAYAVHSYGAL